MWDNLASLYARGGNRILTALRPRDFKSRVVKWWTGLARQPVRNRPHTIGSQSTEALTNALHADSRLRAHRPLPADRHEREYLVHAPPHWIHFR